MYCKALLCILQKLIFTFEIAEFGTDGKRKTAGGLAAEGATFVNLEVWSVDLDPAGNLLGSPVLEGPTKAQPINLAAGLNMVRDALSEPEY